MPSLGAGSRSYWGRVNGEARKGGWAAGVEHSRFELGHSEEGEGWRGLEGHWGNDGVSDRGGNGEKPAGPAQHGEGRRLI